MRRLEPRALNCDRPPTRVAWCGAFGRVSRDVAPSDLLWTAASQKRASASSARRLHS